MKKSFVIFSIACVCSVPVFSTIVPISFERITENSGTNIEGQLMLNVSDTGQVWDSALGQNVNKVTFKFMNNGPVTSSISEIYFYDGSLLNMYSIDDSCDGVDFRDLGSATNPAELPGYSPDFDLVVVLSAAQAQNPESKNGVKASEWVKIGYTLKPDKTIDDLLSDLAAGEVVVGVHVKGIAGGTSDSFVTVPEPATLMILGLGAAAMMLKRKSSF